MSRLKHFKEGSRAFFPRPSTALTIARILEKHHQKQPINKSEAKLIKELHAFAFKQTDQYFRNGFYLAVVLYLISQPIHSYYEKKARETVKQEFETSFPELK
ncbi:MAG: hypothetical protein K0R66_647 [Gammaproteobacteria bacterium]|jgi:hypothetical protein|nr:hypothetical protein [Gammaproteobacteria bacterium]